MAKKETLLALLGDDGLEEGWDARNVATVPDLSSPGTVEESTRTIAEFCVNYNKFLQLYAGVPMLDYGLRAGQRSSVSQAAVLSFLERSPLTTGVGTGTTWSDYIGVAGMPGNAPLAEDFWGIGASPNVEDVEGIVGAFETWKGAVVEWADVVIGEIQLARENYAAGIDVTDFSAPGFPALSLPVPINPGLPAPIWIVINIVAWVVGTALAKVIEAVVDDIIRKIRHGGNADPFLRLFRKFAFLRENDTEQGFADLTSLLLLVLNRPIEIYDSNGKRDVFLDNFIGDE